MIKIVTLKNKRGSYSTKLKGRVGRVRGRAKGMEIIRENLDTEETGRRSRRRNKNRKLRGRRERVRVEGGGGAKKGEREFNLKKG